MTKSTKIIAALGVAAGLGIAALPAGAIFADTNLPLDLTGTTTTAQDVTVSLTVSSAITLGVENVTCATTGAANPSGNAVNLTVKATGSCTHKVAGGTNGATGFTLSVKDKDTDTSLVRSGVTGEVPATSKIEAVDGALGGSTWTAGWNLTGGLLENTAITASNQAVINRTTSGEEEIDMVYNFATQTAQDAGTYSDVITYTIAAN